MNIDRCYYDNEDCMGDLWECEKCGELYCWYHSHTTSRGTDVECVACERERLDNAEYRWNNPYEWLQDRIEELLSNGEGRMVAQEFLGFACAASFESIQEYYENSMDEDGYFEGV